MLEIEHGNRRIGGYFITDQIRQILEEEPDLTISTEDYGNLSIAFGQSIEEGDPSYSIYLRQEKSGGGIHLESAGGRTIESAIKGLKFEIGQIIFEELRKRFEG